MYIVHTSPQRAVLGGAAVCRWYYRYGGLCRTGSFLFPALFLQRPCATLFIVTHILSESYITHVHTGECTLSAHTHTHRWDNVRHVVQWYDKPFGVINICSKYEVAALFPLLSAQRHSPARHVRGVDRPNFMNIFFWSHTVHARLLLCVMWEVISVIILLYCECECPHHMSDVCWCSPHLHSFELKKRMSASYTVYTIYNLESFFIAYCKECVFIVGFWFWFWFW